jgi:acetylornithine/succinyldiaminopimelate/putrescine aminotransferase
VIEAGTSLEPYDRALQAGSTYEVLAAKNATLRLRGSSGPIYSFTDLTSGRGAVNFGHLNPGIDPFEGLSSDVVPNAYPPAARAHSAWLLKKLGLPEKTVVYELGVAAAIAKALHMARRRRAGKIVRVEGSLHALELVHGAGDAQSASAEGAIWIAPGDSFSAWDGVSCLLFEPIQSARGFVPLPLPWIRGLSQSAQAAGVAVIADESQCGFYRFGKLSLAASEYLAPDVFLFGNSMTNGIYPLSALIGSPALTKEWPGSEESWQPAFEAASLGLRAAECVADYIDSTDLDALITPIFQQLVKLSEKLVSNPNLRDFHLAGPTLSVEVRKGRAAEFVRACEQRGVLVSAGIGGARVSIAPPLTIDSLQLQAALKAVAQAAGKL